MGLIAHVPVHADGRTYWFGPDDELPEWAARKMGAHCFEDGVHPYADDEAEPDDEDGSAGGPPPKAGPGASKDAWVAYAESVGVDVSDCGTRDEIIAAVEAAEPAE